MSASDIHRWVLNRDGQCLYGFWTGDRCQFGLDPHHIIHVSQGGPDRKENLITLCRKHHDYVHNTPVPAKILFYILHVLYQYPIEDISDVGKVKK